MNDVYLKEIQLSRELARQIEQITDQYGNVVPENIMRAYRNLCDHYQQQIEEGVQ